MLRLLGTLARVIFGFALASVAAGLVTVLFVNTPADVLAESASRLPQAASETFDLALLTATHAAMFAATFVIIVALVGEWLSIRALTFYLICGVVIALLGFTAQYASEVAGQPTIMNNYAVKAFLTTGFFAGFVYWLAAGQFAGRTPEFQMASPPTRSAKPRDNDELTSVPHRPAEEKREEVTPALPSESRRPKARLVSLTARLTPRRSSAPEVGDEPITRDEAALTEALEPPKEEAADEPAPPMSEDIPATEPAKPPNENEK